MQPKMCESGLFRAMRKVLRTDLCNLGIPNPDAGFILNWFDPSSSEYLNRVEEWQILLCRGALLHPSVELKPYLHFNGWSYDIFEMPMHYLYGFHTVARLFYKFRGLPRRETDMEAVKQRLSSPPKTAMDRWIVARLKSILSRIGACDLSAAIGRFGPGATSEGFSTYDKWSRKGAIPDVPPSVYRFNSRDQWTPCRVDPYGYTKIAEVPKTLKCNRVVSSEPAMRMFAQLAVADQLDHQLHKAFTGHVSLHDQAYHNRYLDRPDAATLDLSDASDLVRVDLVSQVLPQLWPVLARVRSQYARFPDGDEVPLRTFAPMGSGVCFPILTLVSLGILELACGKGWYSAYGDDWILPSRDVPFVIEIAESCGLVINTTKSCTTGYYRESCGREIVVRDRTYDLTSIYIREDPCLADAAKIEELVTRLEDRFFLETASWVAERAACIDSRRYNKHLQRWEVRIRTTSTKEKLSSLDGWSGLMRWSSSHTMGDGARAIVETWAKQAWRYKPASNYPRLAHWLDTRC